MVPQIPPSIPLFNNTLWFVSGSLPPEVTWNWTVFHSNGQSFFYFTYFTLNSVYRFPHFLKDCYELRKKYCVSESKEMHLFWSETCGWKVCISWWCLPKFLCSLSLSLYMYIHIYIYIMVIITKLKDDISQIKAHAWWTNIIETC